MKTALITGASRGIGRVIARTFAQNGYNVIINYNNSQEEAEILAKELSEFNVRTLIVKADVSNCEEVSLMVERALSTFGSIDVLVNNAGVSMSKLLQDCSKEEIEKVIGVNALGTIYTTKAVVPSMISNQFGKIVNISSIWGTSGASMEAVYSASKGAVVAFTKAMAKELALSNINVNCVCPGVIDTDMMNDYSDEDKNALKELTPLNRLGTTKDVANLVYFLATDKADFITGQIITVDGGFNL